MLLEHNLEKFYNAIEEAVEKRYPKNHIPTLALSSGTDSGVIAAALHSLKKDFRIIIFEGLEDRDVLDQRIQFLGKEVTFIDKMDQWEIAELQDQMVHAGFKKGKETGIGIATPHFALAKTENCSKILYSGLGTDELYTNDKKLLASFLFYANQANCYYNVSLLLPLLDPKLFNIWGCFSPEIALEYKKPFRMYMQSKGFPYTLDKINFNI